MQHARDQIAAVVACRREEAVFTSGATESNNLALLGLTAHGNRESKRHILSTRLELWWAQGGIERSGRKQPGMSQ